MEAKELRIGNWVYHESEEKNNPFTVEVDLQDLEFISRGDISYSPIPLTPEILDKAGFTTDEGKVEYVIGLTIGFGSDLVIENEDHESMSCGIKDYQVGFHYFKDIRYLHQLQNLFFAICGEELKIEL